MRAWVVFESMFGNTELIAEAVAVGLSSRIQVQTMEEGVAPTVVEGEVGLLVVGGPTDAFGMSRPGTRRPAAERVRVPAQSFYVTDTDGPLVDGEIERARDWGNRLGANLAVAG